MRKRTLAREYALQVLYQMDITHDAYEAALDNFWQTNIEEPVEQEIKDFAEELVKGVTGNLESIDKKISEYATNWKLERMAVVDRNILRLASFELLSCPQIPVKVSINEAIDLAKKYSGPEAGKFVNGILDKIRLVRPRLTE